jgi:site-specific DNA-methyltransferase (adenine-specific)
VIYEVNPAGARALGRKSLVWCHPILEVGITGMVDHVITDPPYREKVDQNARKGKKTKGGIAEHKLFGFDPATEERRRHWTMWMAAVARRWVAVFSDHESSMEWAKCGERYGLEYVRCLPWVRTPDDLDAERPRKSGAPQFTGDRPATGHEVVVLMHKRDSVRMSWNRGGNTAVYNKPIVPTAQRVHPTEKPVALMRDVLSDFCEPGEIVCDPFCGSGATLVAAVQLGMFAAGGDMDSRWSRYTERRIAAAQRVMETKANG